MSGWRGRTDSYLGSRYVITLSSQGEHLLTDFFAGKGSMLARVNSKGLQILSRRPSSNRLRLLTSYSTSIPHLTSLHIAQSSPTSQRTTIFGVTADFNVLGWIYDSLLQKISPGVTHDLSVSSRPTGAKICKVVAVPTVVKPESVGQNTTRLLVLDIEGRFSIWSAGLEVMDWKEGTSAKTGLKEVVLVACNSEMITAIGKPPRTLLTRLWNC